MPAEDLEKAKKNLSDSAADFVGDVAELKNAGKAKLKTKLNAIWQGKKPEVIAAVGTALESLKSKIEGLDDDQKAAAKEKAAAHKSGEFKQQDEGATEEEAELEDTLEEDLNADAPEALGTIDALKAYLAEYMAQNGGDADGADGDAVEFRQ